MEKHNLTPELREVLLGLPGQDQPVPTVRQQAENCALTIEVWRAAARTLIDLRLAEYGPLIDPDEGRPRGSGYYRTATGDALAAQLEGAPT